MNRNRFIDCLRITALLLAAACVSEAGPVKKPKKSKYSPEMVESFYERGERVYQVDHEASIYLFMRAAKGGHAKAMTRLGHSYETGTGVPVSRRSAIEWYERAVKAGDLSPLYNLGLLYETGEPKRKLPPNYAKAIDLYQRAVAHNSLKACLRLAKIYASCDDPQYHDGEKAVKYATVLVKKAPQEEESHAVLAAAYARNLEFEKAVKAGAQAAGMSSLDRVETRRKHLAGYKIGRPFPAVATDAWIFRAADAGSQWAMKTLADRHYDKDSEMYDLTKARLWYAKAVEHGSDDSLIRLGILCTRGLGGPVDQQTAFRCFKKAAELENPAAYSWLGRMYLGGKGTDVNYKLAQQWYTKAYDTGSKELVLEVSMLRHYGETLEHQSAEELYEQGKKSAELAVNTFGQSGSGSKRLIGAVTCYWLAAEQGYPKAMQELANIYYHGPAYFARKDQPPPKAGTVRVDYRKALDWYEQLARQGVVRPELEECRKLCDQGIYTKKPPPKPKKKSD